MKTEQFDYHLPQALIAQHPLPERDASRLLVLDRAARTWRDEQIRSLPALLRPGDLLVFNNTKVIPARLLATRERTGGKVEIFMLPPESQDRARPDAGRDRDRVVRRVLTRSGGHLSAGESFALPGSVKATLLERRGLAGDLMEFSCAPSNLADYLETHGQIPLPPYIQRPAGPSSAEDKQRYQTIFAAHEGAVAAPTAGLHFSPALLEGLEKRGVRHVEITLHVGIGTFRSVKADEVHKHYVDPEPFSIEEGAAEAVTRAKAEGRRVIAVGTTSLRTLESCWNARAQALEAGSGFADLYVYPPFRFQVVDALITNFHLPKSSLLMLAAAFAAPESECGITFVLRAYEHAKESGYRFFSYGDACFFT